MKTYKFLLVVAMLIFSFAAKAQTYKLKSDANLRAAPGTDATVMVVLKKGQQVKLVEKTNDNWYRVEIDGKKGYISTSVIKRVDSKQDNDHSSDDNASSRKSKSSANTTRNNDNSGSDLPDLAIGLRLGTPTALSIKKYYGTTGLEFVMGTFPNLYYKHDYNWYNNKFNKYYYNGKNYNYAYYDNLATLLLGFNISKQKQSSKIKGLYVYGAGGLSAIFNKYAYGYYYWGYSERQEWFVDYGINAMIGLEYHFSDVPISAFLDGGAYIEFFHEPGYVYPLASIGARYNFQ
jgi:hypothetical protein